MVGWLTFPVHSIVNGRCTCGKECDSPGKHPKIKGWQLGGEIPPGSNIGLVTGQKSNIVVIDIDKKTGGFESLKEWESPLGPLPRTLTSNTQSGGLHYFYEYDPQVNRNRTAIAPGIDIRSDGGFVVLPPSVGVQGSYSWVDQGTPIAKLSPPWVRFLSDIKNGSRNSTLTSLAGVMRARGADASAMTDYLDAINKTLDCPISESEITNIATSISRYEPNPNGNGGGPNPDGSKKKKEKLTDYQLAQLIEPYCSSRLRFSHSLGWLLWTGKRYKPTESAPYNIFNLLIESLLQSSSFPESQAIVKALSADSKRNSIKRMLESFSSLIVEAESIDADPYVINTQSGIVNILDGACRPQQPSDLVSKITSAGYYPDLSEPQKFFEFLDQVLPPTVTPWILDFFSYCMSGDVSRQLFTFFLGMGKNGKTTLLNIMQQLLGEYASPIVYDAVVASSSEMARSLCSLVGLRLGWIEELPRYSVMNDSAVKMIASGIPIMVRPIYKSPYRWSPTIKLVVDTNNIPAIKDHSFGFWRRARIVEFPNIIKTPNLKISDEILEDKDVMLSYLISRYSGIGFLDDNATITDATAKLREDNDYIITFIKEACVYGKNEECKLNELYEAYRQWCLIAGEIPISRKFFSRDLKQAGFKTEHRRNGNYWVGIRPKMIGL